MLLALLLAQVSIQPPNPAGPIVTNPASMGQGAFFEAFGTNARGVAGVCSTTAPTGAKGEALTFTRGSTATCTKTATGGGLATTGIANGDLVVLSSNVARVEYDSAGTLGLLVEQSRTNSCLRSEQINDAAWIPQNSVSALPVITADQAVAPDGATTADRVQIAACPSATNFSLVQSSGSVQTSTTGSLYVKGVSSGGTLGVALNSAGGPNGFTACAFTNTSWTRCVVSATGAAATTAIYFGCGNGVVGMTSTGAADVYVWGGDLENGAYATSYIPTTSAAVTRSADAAYFATSLSTAAGFSQAHSFTLESPNPAEAFTGAAGVYADALNRTQLSQSSTNALGFDIFSTSGNKSAFNVPGAWAGNTTYRVAGSYSGAGASSTVSQYLAGVLQNTSATGLTSAFTITQYGMSLNSPWNTGNAIYSRLCLDPSQTRCR